MEIWEIASILGLNRPPTADEPTASRPVPDGPDAFNVRRMMAEQKAREEGRPATDVAVPSQAEVLDLIRRGKAG
jgi:hypothetical protein